MPMAILKNQPKEPAYVKQAQIVNLQIQPTPRAAGPVSFRNPTLLSLQLYWFS
jgi:hypothetical protein